MNVLARAAGAVCRRATSCCRAKTVLLAVVGVLTAAPCNAYDVLLRWTASPEPGIAGYRIYRGGASRSYSSPLDVGRLDGSTRGGVVYYVDQSHQFGSADYVAVTA